MAPFVAKVKWFGISSVFIIIIKKHYMATWTYKISLLVLKNNYLFTAPTCEIFFKTERKYLHGHVISSMYVHTGTHMYSVDDRSRGAS